MKANSTRSFQVDQGGSAVIQLSNSDEIVIDVLTCDQAFDAENSGPFKLPRTTTIAGIMWTKHLFML